MNIEEGGVGEARATLSAAESIHSSPTDFRNADSVRRSAPRACSGSRPGHSSAHSDSRERGRSASARCASSAVALRVSKLTGRPSRRTRGGPSSEISRPGAATGATVTIPGRLPARLVA